MNDLKEALKREQKRILRLADLTAGADDLDKPSVLLLDKRGDRTYCYIKDEKNAKKYLGTADSKAARQVMRGRYLQEKRSRLITDQKLVEKMMQEYQDYSYEAVMAALPDSYRAIACEDFNNQRYEEIKAWANEDYHCLMPFKDQNGRIRELSPDVLIQRFNHQFVIIEHAGMLSDPGYAMRFGEKCHIYLQNGYVLGKNFFVTSDDKYGGTDSEAIYQVALEVERLFYAE